jgi:hypothetical protein
MGSRGPAAGIARPYRYSVKNNRKSCTICKSRKHTKNFRIIGKTINGSIRFHPWCFPCESTYYKEKHRLKKYGMSTIEYDQRVHDQNGLCFLCNEPDSRLVIDHDHTNGRIRMLLCDRCNGGIGRFLDDPKLLMKTARYIKSFRGI